MAQKFENYVSLKRVATIAWSLLLLAGCSVQPVTTNNNNGAKPSGAKPQKQSAEVASQSPAAASAQDNAPPQSDALEPSGSLALMMPTGMPAKVDQVRLSVARKTPRLEDLDRLYQMTFSNGIVPAYPQLFPAGSVECQLRCYKDGILLGGQMPLPSDSIVPFYSPPSTGPGIGDAQKKQAAELDLQLDKEVTTAAKSDPKGQQLFQLGAGTPQLQRFDLAPGQYFILVEVLDSTTGKVYQKGRGQVEIVAGAVAQANIKLVTVNQLEGGLVVTLGGSGFTKGGQSKVCSEPTPATVCPLRAVILSEGDSNWQRACEAQGHQLVSCISNACQTPNPSEGTQLCSGIVNL